DLLADPSFADVRSPRHRPFGQSTGPMDHRRLRRRSPWTAGRARDRPSHIVGGSSLGGMITAQFAVDYPDRVLAMIVGHTGPYLWDLARDWIGELLRDAQSTLGPQPRSYAWETEGPPTTNPEFAASPIGRLMASVGTGMGRDVESVRKMYRALLSWDQRARYEDLHNLRVPMLFIAGANEPQKTLELISEWRQQVPESELVTLSDCFHAAHRENAPAWNTAVRSFLTRHNL